MFIQCPAFCAHSHFQFKQQMLNGGFPDRYRKREYILPYLNAVEYRSMCNQVKLYRGSFPPVTFHDSTGTLSSLLDASNIVVLLSGRNSPVDRTERKDL